MADVAVTVVRPKFIPQRVFIVRRFSRGRTRTHWKALVEAHAIVHAITPNATKISYRGIIMILHA
jgi:hypothetical protein